MVQLRDRRTGDEPTELNPTANEGSHDSSVFHTENRILANVMAKRFQQEVADPYNQNLDALCTLLGSLFPTRAETVRNPTLKWKFMIGQYDYASLKVSTQLELDYDEGPQEELLDALEELERPTPRKYSSPPTPLLGLEATKLSRKNYVFRTKELRARTALALSGYIREVSVKSPVLNAPRIPIIRGLVDRKQELLWQGGSIGNIKTEEHRSPKAAMREIELVSLRNPDATADERYTSLENRFIDDARRYTHVDELCALTALLYNNGTIYLDNPAATIA